jgi:hypothetical protein
LASDEVAGLACVCQKRQQSVGLKYMPLQFQEYDTHLHLKFVLKKNSKQEYTVSKSAYNVAMHLMSTIPKSYRNLKMDNWSSST